MQPLDIMGWLQYNTNVALTKQTREEDDKLRKELQQADPEKLKKALKQLFSPRKKSASKKR